MLVTWDLPVMWSSQSSVDSYISMIFDTYYDLMEWFFPLWSKLFCKISLYMFLNLLWSHFIPSSHKCPRLYPLCWFMVIFLFTLCVKHVSSTYCITLNPLLLLISGCCTCSPFFFLSLFFTNFLGSAFCYHATSEHETNLLYLYLSYCKIILWMNFVLFVRHLH